MELEFSRPVTVARLGPGGKTYEIEANQEEREALARRFGILAVDALRASVTLKSLAAGPLVVLDARFSADVVQACVVTLDPVPAHIEEAFDLSYSAEEKTPEGEEIVIDVEAEDPPDPIIDGIIDIGEAVAEQLALALDPFPRAPGAEFRDTLDEGETGPKNGGPFAALAALKKK